MMLDFMFYFGVKTRRENSRELQKQSLELVAGLAEDADQVLGVDCLQRDHCEGGAVEKSPPADVDQQSSAP